jgi:hypothetical protein
MLDINSEALDYRAASESLTTQGEWVVDQCL